MLLENTMPSWMTKPKSRRRGRGQAALRSTAVALLLACASGCLHSGRAPTAPSTRHPAGRPWVNSLGMKFVPVPGTAMQFSVWETRVRDFEAFVRATGYDAGQAMYIAESNRWELRPGYNWQQPGFAQSPDHPVVGVNWHDATAFCAWLTALERSAGRLDMGYAYRLPTDLEWSRAVGLTNEPGRTPQERFVQVKDLYPWGTNATPPLNAGNFNPSFGVDPYEHTAPVGSFPANAIGLHDLGGNVIEWCVNGWNDEPRYKVLRGSGWHTDCSSCLLSSYRYPNLPDLRIDYYGFRVVLAPVETPR